jgi:hypothetical protein
VLEGTASSVAKKSSCLLLHQQGVCHCCGLAIYIKKYLKAKRRIMETQIFRHAKIYSSQKPLKATKILQDIITL